MATGGDVMCAAKIEHLLGLADTAGAESEASRRTWLEPESCGLVRPAYF
jgi:hypothetical protein